jgi:hypothetical protein
VREFAQLPRLSPTSDTCSPSPEDLGAANEDPGRVANVRYLTWRGVLAAFGVLSVALVFLGSWLNATKIGGQGPTEPFSIAGNFY